MEKAHELLTRAVGELVSGEDWAAMLDMAGRFHRYSANNALLINLQCPGATRVAGYKAWQALGRQVRKGEKGIAILAPVVYRRRPIDDSDPDALVGVLAGFRVAFVFDISQTEGDPLPEIPVMPLAGDAPGSLWDLLAAQVGAAGFELVRGECAPANGVTDFGARRVTVAADLTPAMAAKTLAHELAHATMHDRVTTCRGVAEVEAESVAYLVTNALGLDSGSYSFGYVASWARGEVQVVLDAAERSIRTARAILAAAGLDDATGAEPGSENPADASELVGGRP